MKTNCSMATIVTMSIVRSMTDDKPYKYGLTVDWIELARGLGGLAAILTLLAHFILPSVPFDIIRVQVLLLLIGILLELDEIKNIIGNFNSGGGNK